MRRLEDPALLRGQSIFLADISAPDTLHASFVRSTLPSGRLVSIETAAATAAPGVVAVWTAHDLDLPPFMSFPKLGEEWARPLLAAETVEHVGDPVAVVAAETVEQALDAAELVVVEIDTTEPVLDARASTVEVGCRPAPHDDDVFASADVVVSTPIANQKVASVPLENSGILVKPTDHGLDVYCTSQGSHGVRDEMARALGLDASAIRVRTPAVGGGFGGRGTAPLEFHVVAAIALSCGRPMRWIESRSENFVVMPHGRGHDRDMTLAATAAGRFVAVRSHAIADTGAYAHMAAGIAPGSARFAPGAYDIAHVESSYSTVITNTTWVGAYRGAGQPEAIAAIERLVDMCAAELDVDPVELRRRNLATPPHRTATGFTYDSGDYRARLAEALDLVDEPKVRAEQARRREAGEQRALGLGVASYVQITARGDADVGAVDVRDDGSVTLRVGSASHGQGHRTAFALIVADVLGVQPDVVQLVASDTDATATGLGTGGSRSLQLVGSALHEAAKIVLAEARDRAAELLEAPADDIVVADSGLTVTGVPAATVPWSELAPLSAQVDFAPEAPNHPNGTHISIVEVDTETGAVTVLEHVAVDDCGRVIDAPSVEGQQHGGSAAGISQAVFEGIVYSDDGVPLTTNLLDYGLPSAAEFPMFTTATADETTDANPLGARGIGENGAIAATPAVQNAVVDAVAHLGVRHIDLPLTPERVWTAIRTAAAASPRP